MEQETIKTWADSLEALWLAIAFKQGVFVGLAAWIAASRTVFKGVAKWLQNGLTVAVQRAADSVTSQDDDLLQGILSSRWYRVMAFFVDWLASIKLPTLETYKAALAKKGGA